MNKSVFNDMYMLILSYIYHVLSKLAFLKILNSLFRFTHET